MRLFALVGGVHKDCALTEQIAMLFQKHVANREHQRMAGMKHRRKRRAGLIERADSFARKADALITFEHRGEFTAVAAGDDGGRVRGWKPEHG